MKKVIVNQQNINMVYGMLKKFFLNKSFIEWHTFSGGFKKRIPTHFIKFDIKTTLEDGVTIVQHDIVCYKICNHASEFTIEIKKDFSGKKVIAVCYNKEEGFLVKDGIEIMFLGNRINIKDLQGLMTNMKSICIHVIKFQMNTLQNRILIIK